MYKKRKSTKFDSSLGKDIGSSTQHTTGYEAEEVNYLKTESKKEGQKKKKRVGNEILDGLTHEVPVEYGDWGKKQESYATLRGKKGKYRKTVLYNLLPILHLLQDRIENNNYSKKLLTRFHNQQKTLKKYAPMMVCKGMIRQHVINAIMEKDYSFTNTLAYINPAITLLQNLDFVDTFREKPKPRTRTKFDLEEARETIQKLGKKTRLGDIEQLKLERAKVIASKKNEDTNPLYYYLTIHGEQELANFGKDLRGSNSIILQTIMQDFDSLISSSTADTEE